MRWERLPDVQGESLERYGKERRGRALRLLVKKAAAGCDPGKGQGFHAGKNR